jgi:hypothetical protein
LRRVDRITRRSHQRGVHDRKRTAMTTADEVDDAQISEIVEQELATAVADPDPVFVVYIEYDGDEYTSAHTSQAGAENRVQETASQWGFADVLGTDELTYRITKVPLETP